MADRRNRITEYVDALSKVDKILREVEIATSDVFQFLLETTDETAQEEPEKEAVGWLSSQTQALGIIARRLERVWELLNRLRLEGLRTVEIEEQNYFANAKREFVE